MKDQIFCEVCDRKVPYDLYPVQLTGRLKGRSYTYSGQEARCRCCGSPLWASEVHDANLEALYDCYRREQGLISLEVLRALPKKYHIGKRPLSLLLGWGEHTFSRYCDGDLPRKEYSDFLLDLNADPALFLSLLQNHHERMNSPTAYEKSLRAVRALVEGAGGDERAMSEAARYLLLHGEEMTPQKLQQMLYYVQGWFFAFTGRFLFVQDCEAWEQGPVFPQVCDVRGFAGTRVAEGEGGATAEEQAIYDSVLLYFGCYNGKVLERFTRFELPWISARAKMPADSSSPVAIDKTVLGDYFRGVKDKYRMFNPADIQDYAVKMLETCRVPWGA